MPVKAMTTYTKELAGQFVKLHYLKNLVIYAAIEVLFIVMALLFSPVGTYLSNGAISDTKALSITSFYLPYYAHR